MSIYPNLQIMKTLTRIAVVLCLFLLPLKYFFEVFPCSAKASVMPVKQVDLLWWEIQEDMNNDDVSDNWKVIRKARLSRQITRGEVKTLYLCWGKIPFTDIIQKNKGSLEREMIPDKASIWVKDADGRISQTTLISEKDRLSVNVPENLDLNGIYLIGISLDTGALDIDSDGIKERIYLSAKRFIYHRKTGGHQGNKRGAFFDEPDKFPLEIGCSDSGFRSASQRAYREYEMKVIYQGKPLADAEVNILSESGWRKTVKTDSIGKFLITPFGGMENDEQEKYLYVAAYHDLLKKEYHCATLIMNINTYPEWRSKSSGFMLWTILGTGLLLIIIIIGIYRKKKHARDAILQFENRESKRDN